MHRATWTVYATLYIRNVKQDYGGLFRCPVCGPLAEAPIVTQDGTSIGANAKFAKQALFSRHDSLKVPRDAELSTGLDFEERCVVRFAPVRDSIIAFCDKLKQMTKSQAVCVACHLLCVVDWLSC